LERQYGAAVVRQLYQAQAGRAKGRR